MNNNFAKKNKKRSPISLLEKLSCGPSHNSEIILAMRLRGRSLGQVRKPKARDDTAVIPSVWKNREKKNVSELH